MKAAVLTAPETIEIKEVPSPEPAKGEVLVRVREAGICGSDFSVFAGRSPVRFPLIPGHEAVGEIAGLGDGITDLEPGQRVTIQPNFACGGCRMCLNGMDNICINKVRLGIDTDGVFAEYVAVPARYVWPLPDTLSDSVGTLVEPLSVAIHAFTKSPLITRKELVIQGAMIYKDEFRVAIDLLNKGAIQTDLLITGTYPLEELAHALANFPSPDRVKTLITIN